MIEQVIILGFILALGSVIVIGQAIVLQRIFRSSAWLYLAGGFILVGVRQLWTLIRLPAAIIEASAQGTLPAALTAEQWMIIGSAVLALVLWIIGLSRLRHDLRRLGVD